MTPSRIMPLLLGSVLLIGIISLNAGPAYAVMYECAVESIDGSQEVPAVDTEGTGTADVMFDSSTNELTWSIEFSELSGPATAAHFHGPAAAGVNAGVQVNIGEVSGLTSPMDGSAELTSDQAAMLLDGLMYINIHTASNTGGEIRGQVSCEVPTDDGEDWQTASLSIGDDEFDIRYMINGGTVESIDADPDTMTLLVTINSTGDGILTIDLPRDAIDTDDGEFAVFIDEEFGSFVVDEVEVTDDVRTLAIEFEQGSEMIEIVGTSMASAPQTTHTIPLQAGGQTHEITYQITGGTLDELTGDPEASTITAMITAEEDGELVIQLPREVADSADTSGDSDYVVLVDGVESESVDDDMGEDVRTLTIPFTAEAQQIDIRGTFVVPEFGAIGAIVLAVAIVGIIAATAMYSNFKPRI